MCCGCGEHKLKKELVRIVRASDNTLSLDTTGKKAGRGAYICKSCTCLDRAIKKKRLEKSLSLKISEDIFAQLREELSR